MLFEYRGWVRVGRVIANSIGFVMMVIVGTALLSSNPLFGLLFLLAALDQLEDVYYYTTGRRFIPSWLAPLDAFFEAVMFGFGLGVFIVSLVYYTYFATWFFKSMLALSVMIMWSSVEDVVQMVEGGLLEIRQKARFVKKKG